MFHSNFKHATHIISECDECEETKKIVYDQHHDEIICLTCGTVLYRGVSIIVWDTIGLKKSN